MLPCLGDPVDDLNQVIAAHVLIDLRLYQLPPQETAQETFDRLSVVGAQHPPTRRQMINGKNRSRGPDKSAQCKTRFLIKAAHVRDDEAVSGISTITTTSFHIHIKLMSGS